MDIMQMLEIFKDPNTIHSLSMGDKMAVTLLITGLGMGITFAALIILWGCITTMSKVILGKQNNDDQPKEQLAVTKAAPAAVEANITNEEDEELIAVIAAAVAASLNTSIHNIIVKNIVQVSDTTPSWGVVGRMEQMNTRF